MTEVELEIQEQIVKVFENLKDELPKISKEVTRLGWGQRNALISHVYSNYNKHKELNEARTNWKKMIVENNVHNWLFDLMVSHRDLFGYFENYNLMLSEIDGLISLGTKKEEYEIVEILLKWRRQLPSAI